MSSFANTISIPTGTATLINSRLDNSLITSSRILGSIAAIFSIEKSLGIPPSFIKALAACCNSFLSLISYLSSPCSIFKANNPSNTYSSNDASLNFILPNTCPAIVFRYAPKSSNICAYSSSILSEPPLSSSVDSLTSVALSSMITTVYVSVVSDDCSLICIKSEAIDATPANKKQISRVYINPLTAPIPNPPRRDKVPGLTFFPSLFFLLGLIINQIISNNNLNTVNDKIINMIK